MAERAFVVEFKVLFPSHPDQLEDIQRLRDTVHDIEVLLSEYGAKYTVKEVQWSE